MDTIVALVFVICVSKFESTTGHCGQDQGFEESPINPRKAYKILEPERTHDDHWITCQGFGDGEQKEKKASFVHSINP